MLKVVLTGGTLLVSQNLDFSSGMGRYRREDGRMGDGNLGLGGLLGLGATALAAAALVICDRFGWKVGDLSITPFLQVLILMLLLQ